MAAVAAFLPRLCAKNCLNIISIAADDIEERRFAGCLEVSHSCLNHMSCTIEFVPVAEIRPPLIRLNDSIMWVEIASWLLRRSDKCNYFIEQCLKRWIRMCC